jgi:putative NADH-flavin reductase
MNLFLLGATGRTGKQVLEQALRRGHIVHALVRDKQKVKNNHPCLILFEGNPADKTALAAAMKGCNAIISALNISRTSDFPWSPLRSPKDLLSTVMKHIIELALELRIRRIVFVSAWGVAETRKDIPGWFRWFIEHSNIRHPYLDHERQEDLLKKTMLEWTGVRAVGLTNSKKKKEVRTSFDNRPKPRLIISRYNLAGFILEAVEKNMYVRMLPVVFQ